ncbi:DHH family phosphoesterase [Rheinheimera baltica]|uniref:DHH family phosphoesterase n=1 Tax=Rheinheimera baltica TaxID=67576 RepID=A0ABT9I3D3_9GAMM|nr:DHH family phosphoesterase [Rheinheimera baltica]MDP5137887.1 DHH family phosphoesterase [Rheinheimera baltica]MDP5149770.1 DHH family phosphoesterase [Rheinheimera baltica]
MYIDVFNGDADGIFSLIQLRKVTPVPASQQLLVTGVKRDISLLRQISDKQATGANITVLDISFDKNNADVERLVNVADSLFYCDHHQASKLFSHYRLTSVIDTSPKVCTALLINTYLNQALPLWAITAAYGDGLDSSADALADEHNLSVDQRAQLKQLGVLVNYNGYGASEADLHFAPAALYQKLMAYDTPFAVVSGANSPFATLKAGYNADLTHARGCKPLTKNDKVLAIQLDNAPWAARISGTYGNILAAENPDKAVVIATSNADGSLTISLRAPKNKPYGAADICSQFATGGGREGAAGVNVLPVSMLADFIAQVQAAYC